MYRRLTVHNNLLQQFFLLTSPQFRRLFWQELLVFDTIFRSVTNKRDYILPRREYIYIYIPYHAVCQYSSELSDEVTNIT